MSGHDFIDWPHETAHEMVAAPGRGCRGDCGGNSGQCPHTDGCLPFIAVEWTRWPLVDELRAKPARERRTGPRNNWSTR